MTAVVTSTATILEPYLWDNLMLMDIFPSFLNQIHIFLELCLHKVTFLLLCDLKSKPHICLRIFVDTLKRAE